MKVFSLYLLKSDLDRKWEQFNPQNEISCNGSQCNWRKSEHQLGKMLDSSPLPLFFSFHINSIHKTWERQQGGSPEGHPDAESGGRGPQGCDGGAEAGEPPPKQTGEPAVDPVLRPCICTTVFSKVILLTFGASLYFGFCLCCGCVWRKGMGKEMPSCTCTLFSTICSLPSRYQEQPFLL